MLDPKQWMKAVAIILMLLLMRPSALPVGAQGNETLAFVNVSVIPMDNERVLESQTVLVQGDRIVEVGAVDAVAVPDGAQVIEGNGRHLIPGLTDAHFHILDNPDSLILALANGITTVRDPNADYIGTGQQILRARDQIAAGERLGPTITAAKSFIGASAQIQTLFDNVNQVVAPWLSVDWGDALNMPVDPASGRALVMKAHKQGYDIVKINWHLTRDTFDSIVAAAKELGMPLLAHVPAAVGVEHAIQSGVEIQHNGNVIAFLAKDYVRQPGPNYLDRFDLSEADQRLPELVALMKENGVAFTPTMVVDATAFELFDNLPNWSQAAILQRPEYRYAPPAYMTAWSDAAGGEFGVVARARGAASVADIAPTPDARAEILALHLRQLKALVDAGVPVMIGTDSSAVGVLWGFSIHDELALFVKAGLTPYQALAAATRIPSQVMGDSREWGAIAAGKRADMVLLNANPLDDIGATRDIAGVMVRGRWLPQTELQHMLDELAAKYEAEAAGLVTMEPFESELFSGLAPSGWREVDGGVFARGNPEVDPTMLVQLAAPDVPSDLLALNVLGRFGVTDLPAPADHVETAHLAWDIYLIRHEPGVLGVALAEQEGVAYLVLLVTPPDQADMLAKSAFFPALNALTPTE